MKTVLAIVSALATTLAAAQLTPEQMKAARERANAPAPKIEVSEFHGVHETTMPANVGAKGPAEKVVLECARGACKFSIGGMSEAYPNPGLVRMGLFERTRASVAKRFSGAQLRGCVNLAGDAMPDGPFACKVDGMPGGKASVLLVPPGPPGDEIVLYTRGR